MNFIHCEWKTNDIWSMAMLVDVKWKDIKVGKNDMSWKSLMEKIQIISNQFLNVEGKLILKKIDGHS